MKWCTISSDYLDYLRASESRIPQDNYTKIREDGSKKQLLKPFFHYLFEKGDYVYVGQVNHFQPRHNRMQEDLDFKKIYDLSNPSRALCVVNLNYMFPVPKTEIHEFDYSQVNTLRDFDSPEEELNYVMLLKKELRSINSRSLDAAATELYDLKKENPTHIVSQRTFDFDFLEKKCKEWIADKQGTNTAGKHLSEQELLDLNQKIRYTQDTKPEDLINASFTYNNEEYEIKELELIPGKTKDMALLERSSDGALFQDNDFASQKPLTLNLIPADKSSPHLVKPKVGHIFSK